MSATASDTFTHTSRQSLDLREDKSPASQVQNRSPHQEVVGDGAEFLVADDGQTNQGVAYDGQQGDDELRCDVDPFKVRHVPRRHLRRTASGHVHDPTNLETLEETVSV